VDLPPAPPPQGPSAGIPTGTPFDERSARGRRLVLVAAILLLALAGVALALYLTARRDAFPSVVLGYERLSGEQADRVEAAMESIRIGDIEIRAALYGEDGRPRLLAATYGNYPEAADVRAIMQGAAAGAEASGGRIDEASLQISRSGGSAFACVRGRGPGFLVPGGPSERGVMCVFDGDPVGVLVTTHTTDPMIGLIDVREFVEAYRTA
jgi:hypothetical protein